MTAPPAGDRGSPVATGVGSFPGTDAPAYTRALRVVLEELPELPHLPELPGRGAVADTAGRAVALLSGLGADLQPAGWRLTGSTAGGGREQRRARSLLAQDLDVLEEETQGYTGPWKVQVAGPWTLAATVERPRGDKLLADRGACRDLAQSLAEGVGEHVAELRRRVPGVTEVLVQLDEPALPAVLDARVPTASGLQRHRGVDTPDASPALEELCSAVTAAGAVPLVHCCAPDVPVDLLRRAGARGVSVDLDVLAPEAYEPVAGVLEDGDRVMLGVVPTTEPDTVPGEKALTGRVTRFLEMLALDPAATADRLAITPACGLAGAGEDWARRALRLCRAVARHLGEEE